MELGRIGILHYAAREDRNIEFVVPLRKGTID